MSVPKSPSHDGLWTSKSDEGEITATDIARKDIEANSKAGESLPALEGEQEHHYVTGIKLCLIMISLIMGCFLMTLSASVIVTAIPSITSEFHSVADIGWYGSAYLLANCCIQPLSGKLYTYFSLKYTFLCFLGLFELGALLCAVSSDSNMFIVGRAVQGCGGSGIVNGALTMIATAAPMEKRPLLIGIMMSMAYLGQIIGPLIGGILTEHASWIWCFYINLPAGFLTALFLLSIPIPSIKDRTRYSWTPSKKFIELDPIGFLLLTPTLIMFLLALEWGGITFSWSSPTILGLFCGSFVLFSIFLYWENRMGSRAMIPLHMLARRLIWCSCLVALFQSGGLIIVSYYLPVWFQVIMGESPTESGVHILPSILAQILFAILAGALVSRLGYFTPWAVLGCVCSAVGSGCMGLFGLSTKAGEWIGYQVLTGAGRGMVMQVPVTAIQNSLPPHEIPIGSSLATFSSYLGNAMFLAVGSTVLTNSLSSQVAKYAPNVDSASVIDAGATGLRTLFSGNEETLQAVLRAYNESVIRVFYLSAGSASIAFLCTFGMGWGTVKKKNAKQANDSEIGEPPKTAGNKSDNNTMKADEKA